MRPKIWLYSTKRTWLESAIDDKGTLDIYRIAVRTNLSPETLLFSDLAAYDGITIQEVMDTFGSTVGQSKVSAVLVDGDAKLAAHTEDFSRDVEAFSRDILAAEWLGVSSVYSTNPARTSSLVIEGPSPHLLRLLMFAGSAGFLGEEGEPLSKKAKRSPDEFQFLVPANSEESELVASQSYFKKLLEAPLDLPKSAEALQEFLSARTEKLPVGQKSTYYAVRQPALVKFCTSEAEKPLASFVEIAFAWMSGTSPVNEATSSARLYYLTGFFLEMLDSHAPADFGLLSLSMQLDSTGATGTSALSTLKPLKRPDFLLFLREAPILRWENKNDASDIAIAIQENASKLCVWSPLYYGTLPFVIGGCCGGGLFQWLKLSPVGKEIAVEPISEFYDLKKPRGVALLLHSTIRMYCLLRKLQEELIVFPPVKLYTPIPRSGGGEVTPRDWTCTNLGSL